MYGSIPKVHKLAGRLAVDDDIRRAIEVAAIAAIEVVPFVLHKTFLSFLFIAFLYIKKEQALF